MTATVNGVPVNGTPEEIAAAIFAAAKPEAPKVNGKKQAAPKAQPQAVASNDPVISWIYKAIKYYRQLPGSQSKGIHTVMSGFNQAFRSQFPGKDPIAATTLYEQKGLLQGHPARKGHMIYLPGEMPTQRSPRDCSADLAAIAKL